MARPLTRLTAALAVGATLTVAGCGSSSGGSGTPDNPKDALVAGVGALGDADVLTTTLRLDGTGGELGQLGKASDNAIQPSTADAIASARLVVETTHDKTFSLRAVDGGK